MASRVDEVVFRWRTGSGISGRSPFSAAAAYAML